MAFLAAEPGFAVLLIESLAAFLALCGSKFITQKAPSCCAEFHHIGRLRPMPAFVHGPLNSQI